ncbi:hypothetical protein LZ554_001132 [Drepanopeziza brunnea f. sp. 'monogermtubi']|nr:hypothetical protein LZ554_001132 [Drepanopeziza brunnea f. sp. 'monogermtubi']
MAAMAGGLDISRPGKYPIVLSDALLGKTSKDIYTGVRYNHKPDTSSDAPSIHLQPSDSDSDPASYDLLLKDNSEEYSYQGTRTSGDGQYVLIFDPVKEHFVIHRIDSTFEMNMVSAPWTQNTSKLRSQYPQLEPEVKSQAPPKKASKATKKDPTKAVLPRKKVEKAKKPKPPVIREPTPEPQEEEESDDGLTIEYPEAPTNYQPKSTPLFDRQVSDEDEDAEGEDDDEFEEVQEHNQDVDHLKLPSPANNNAGQLSDEDLELDLEAELEQAFKDGESSESEEE